MARHRNLKTEVVVSVDDSKDDRFDAGWESAEEKSNKAPAKKAASSKSEK